MTARNKEPENDNPIESAEREGRSQNIPFWQRPTDKTRNMQKKHQNRNKKEAPKLSIRRDVSKPALFLLLTCSLHLASAQQNGVGIGTNTPANSAVLEVHSATGTKGMLIPRVPDRNNVVTPSANGLLLIQDTPDSFSNAVVPRTKNNLYQYNDELNNNNGGWQTVFPRGGIIMWSGDLLPEGWALCDGTNDTPDLSGRFIVGYDVNANTTPVAATGQDLNYGAVGNTGGSNSHLLSVDEMPEHSHNKGTLGTGPDSHSHTYTDIYSNSDGKNRNSPRSEDTTIEGGNNSYSNGGKDIHFARQRTRNTSTDTHNHSINGTTGTSGGTQPHENRPPYYVLAFIMKL